MIGIRKGSQRRNDSAKKSNLPPTNPLQPEQQQPTRRDRHCHCIAMASPPQAEISEELIHVQKVWASMRDRSPIYEFLLSEVDILSASKAGSITARLIVKPVHTNSKGTLHGTVSACLVDWAGGMAIVSTGSELSGFSTDMHTTFVSTAIEGDVLEISALADRVGRTLAFTTVEIKTVADNGTSIVVSKGSHTKFVRQ